MNNYQQGQQNPNYQPQGQNPNYQPQNPNYQPQQYNGQQPQYGQQQPQYGQQQQSFQPEAIQQSYGQNDAPLLNKNGDPPEEKTGCQDVIFAILFLVHLGGMIYFCYHFGRGLNIENNPNISSRGALYLGMIVAGGILFAFIWMIILRKFATGIIKFMLIFHAVMWFVYAGVSFGAGSMVGAIICCVFGLLSFLYYCAVKSRIPFATVCLEIATTIVANGTGTVVVALVAVLIQACWGIGWALGTFGYNQSLQNKSGSDQDQDKMNGAIVFGLILSLYWTLEVVKYTVHCTTAGVAASWYFTPNESAPTCSSLKRAMTTSFGSICFGALLISIIKAMRAMVRAAQNSGENDNIGAQICLCLAQCLLGCLESAAEIFNEFGFAYVATYGYSYCHACKEVVNLFKDRGWTALINFDLVHMALMMGALMSGLCIGAIVAAVAYFVEGDKETWGTFAGLGIVLGFFMTWVVLNVVSSAVTTLFVMWVNDPAALEQNHRDASEKFKHAAEGYRNEFGV